MPERPGVFRAVWSVLAVAGWVFVFLSIATFQPTDWPSHAVYPHGPIRNACGSAGALVAYWSYVAVGQGVYPLLFFSGVFLVLGLLRSRVSDLWLRGIGLALLSVSFAAAVHFIRPGTPGGLPEGTGGMVGIGAAGFLQQHFSGLGTALVLLIVFIVGLLLAADDLVLKTPAMIGGAIERTKQIAPGLKLPTVRLPEIRRGTGATVPGSSSRGVKPVEDDDDETPTPVLLRPEVKAPSADAPVELHYDDDVASDVAHRGDDEPPPSESATVPPPEQSRVDEPPPPPKKDIIVKLPQMLKPRQTAPPPPKELGEYHLPPWDVLSDPEYNYADSQEQFVREKAAVLEQAMREFQIDARVVEIDTGPVITMYELALAPGVKVGAVSALTNDIMRALKAESVRIVAPIPGKSTVGIEVPNEQKEKVRLKELMQLAPEAMQKMGIPLFLGKDASGGPLITDLTAMPHCLIAGTTGSGKSVCINSIIMSVMYLQRPDMVKLILVDPKVVEMAPFKDIPHLMCPVINEAAKATSVLEWATQKMDERYDLLAEAGVRNIKGYNALTLDELIERFKPATPEEEAKIPKKLPYIVIIVDELADLMMTSGKEVESHIVRIAQKARAVGIHLVLATQRPQATVVTGLIKANMPSKIAFRVASKMDSRIVLDQNGAEVLLGQGDMLFMPPGASKPIRGQGTYIDDREIRESVKLVRGLAEQQFEPELVQIKASVGVDEEAAKDELFDEAVRIVLETRRGSVSLLQRRLTIGYSRASRLIEAMAAAGLVGEYKGSQAREATITLEEWEAMKAAQQADAASGMSV
jgi:S-DNA-T family DNA segregation ATPase FtsK/SpoIIIE